MNTRLDQYMDIFKDYFSASTFVNGIKKGKKKLFFSTDTSLSGEE